MALEGSIRDFSLADIFQLIGIQRKTGILTLNRKDEEVKVSFMGGMVVNADSHSGRIDDRLGSVLAKTGKVSAEDLQRALQIQKQTLKKLGVVLIENEIARPEDLREALNIQITQIVYRLFRWKDGDYHFEQDVQVDYDRENFTPMSAESILMEGMRMIDEWPVIERKITSFSMVFERVALEGGNQPIVDDTVVEESDDEDAEDDFDLIFGGDDRPPPPSDADGQIRLTREEGLVYQQVDGQVSVQEIIERVMLPEFEVCRALYDLSNRNLIVPVAREQKSAKGGARSKSERRAGFGRGAAAVVPLAAAAWVGFAWAGGLPRQNPVNFLIQPPVEVASLEALNRQVSVVRARRLSEAIEIYVLSKREYPTSLQQLATLGLVDDSELRDPWGREIALEVLADRMLIEVRLGPGDAAPVHSEPYFYRR